MKRTRVSTSVTVYSHTDRLESEWLMRRAKTKEAMHKALMKGLTEWINHDREVLFIRIEDGSWRVLVESRRDLVGTTLTHYGKGDDKPFVVGTLLNYLEDAIRQVKELAEYHYRYKSETAKRSQLPWQLEYVLDGCPSPNRRARTRAPFVLSFDCAKYVLAAISLTKLYNDLCGQCGRNPLEYPDFSYIRTISRKFAFTPAEAERHAEGVGLIVSVPAVMSGENGKP